MSKLKLKTPKNDGSPPPETEVTPVPLSPLKISGVVVKKKDLVAALKIFAPALSDLQLFEDGETFYLVMQERPSEINGLESTG